VQLKFWYLQGFHLSVQKKFGPSPTLAGKCGFGKPSGDGLNGFFFSYDEMEFSPWTMAVTVTTGRTIAKP
jgi:hypothetical protein